MYTLCNYMRDNVEGHCHSLCVKYTCTLTTNKTKLPQRLTQIPLPSKSRRRQQEAGPHMALATELALAGALASNLVFGVAIVICNKAVVALDGFDFIVALTLCHFLVTLLACAFMAKARTFVPKLVPWRNRLGLSLVKGRKEGGFWLPPSPACTRGQKRGVYSSRGCVRPLPPPPRRPRRP